MGNQPNARQVAHRTTQHRKMRMHIHALSGIRIHNPSVQTVEDSMCLRLYGHWDWLSINSKNLIKSLANLPSAKLVNLGNKFHY